MIYSAFLIPIIVSLVGYLLFKRKVTPAEIGLNILITGIIIVLFVFGFKKMTTSDVEYNGHLIVEARFYEEWETYVDQTCTRQVACGTDDEGEVKYCTETYDCSYCDEHPERYELIDDSGNTFPIEKEEYYRIVKKWGKKPTFKDMERNINHHFMCGKDGDMYFVTWDGNVKTSMVSTTPHRYDNILQYGNSAFDFERISKEDAKTLGLYDYPDINVYYQSTVLGLEKTTIKNKEYFRQKIDYFNGIYGKKYNNRVYVLIFPEGKKSLATKQEKYWFGGNRNEVVICIGVDKTNKIKWVKPFSWVKDKTLIPSLRNDIMDLGDLDKCDGLYDILVKQNGKYFKWRDFDKDFSYLKYKVTTGQMIFIYLMSLFISVLIMIFSVKNEYDNNFK